MEGVILFLSVYYGHFLSGRNEKRSDMNLFEIRERRIPIVLVICVGLFYKDVSLKTPL